MKISIHIGSTKTGSSALQMHMFQARDRLREHGILYPELGVKSNAHHVLFASVHPGAWGMHTDELSVDEKKRFTYFEKTLLSIFNIAVDNKFDHLILSSEYWWCEMPQRCQTLISQQFCEHDVRLVACLRRQDRWLEASYLQAVKSGEKKSIKDWLDACLSTPTMGGANYLKILNHWTEILLPYETVIVPYEFEDRTQYMRSVVSKLCDSNTGELVVPSEANVVNKSPDQAGVAAILAMNKSDQSETNRQQKMSEILKSHSRPENTKNATLLSHAEQRSLYERFERINELVNRLHCNPNSSSLFAIEASSKAVRLENSMPIVDKVVGGLNF